MYIPDDDIQKYQFNDYVKIIGWFCLEPANQTKLNF